jgi:hypothetical protein
MAIPDSVQKTAEGYLKYLSHEIENADKHWSHYGWAVSHAYAAAYKQQLDVLQRVKKAIEARLEFDHEMVTFALSLLTVGVAGGVAGVIARKVIDKSAPGGEMMIDALKQTLQRAQKAAADEDIEAISPKPKVEGDAFAPAGVTPEEYTTALQEGITYHSALLSDLQGAVQYDSGPTKVGFGGSTVTLRSSGLTLTADDARRVTEMVLNSTFVRDRPPTEISGEALIPKASLALWIGWAYGRDVNYWRKALGYPINNPVFDEEFDWEEVRLKLISLGVPSFAITARGTDYHWMNRTSPKTGLDMWGFLDWVSSPASTRTLFDGKLPKDRVGFEAAKAQMDAMQLTPSGWIRRPVAKPVVIPPGFQLGRQQSNRSI